MPHGKGKSSRNKGLSQAGPLIAERAGQPGFSDKSDRIHNAFPSWLPALRRTGYSLDNMDERMALHTAPDTKMEGIVSPPYDWGNTQLHCQKMCFVA